MRKYTQLSQELRYQIYSFNKVDWTQCVIAKEIGVDQSTISRELNRNKGKKGYRPKQAHEKAVIRKKKMRLDNLTQKDTQYVMNQLNYKPRKVIGFQFSINLFWRYVVQYWNSSLNYALAI